MGADLVLTFKGIVNPKMIILSSFTPMSFRTGMTFFILKITKDTLKNVILFVQ